jgi:enamine deaminase RidA (YjgF/YER057c/UK114 family)
MVKQAYPAHPEVPISKAVRAGDFVFTSAYGPWIFDPKKVVYDADGNLVDDGAGRKGVSFDEQVHLTFGFVREALAAAGCTLDDVVDCQCWLADGRDFVRFNEIYQTYFTKDPPVRSVFPIRFMFDVKVEIKVIAYKPLRA